MLGILLQNPLMFMVLAGALVISISIHEFAHAFTSDKLGDPTARYLGRVTLNPKAHLDPIGTLFLLLMGFGWGRPVPYNPLNLKNPKRDAAIIAFAGPLSNFTLALIVSIILKLVGVESALGGILYLLVFYNLILGIFNLIPVHPLDGFKVIYGLLPRNLAFQWKQMEPYGVFILMVLIMTRSISAILLPLVDTAMNFLGL